MVAPIDPLNFVAADDFFQLVQHFNKPTKIVGNVESSTSSDSKDPLRYAAHITLEGTNGGQNTHILVQFVTPQVWRIRYNPKFTNVSQYPDANSRTIVENSFADLVDHLQDEARDSNAWNSYPAGPQWHWNTTLEKTDHWIFSSVDYKDKAAPGVVNVKLHIFDAPFKIVATRTVPASSATVGNLQTLGLPETSEQVVWQTSDQTFVAQDDPNIDAINNVVLNVAKPRTSQYLGFGEQGGRTVLKQPTYMNYFCYDNYNYTKVYGQGATDVREPLYHSTPFYLEMNSTPGFKNVTGLMVDNYSQVSLDFGKSNAGNIAIATRFNTFDAYIFAADNAPNLIWQYTSLVGRPKLKPRFILGHHQGCYGWLSNNDLKDVVNGYRASGTPLDGMHIDVDFQDRYRTFTVNGINFPNVADLLNGFRKQGVKCCTNITPIMTLRESDQDPYQALRNFWDQKDKLNPATNLLVTDLRYTKGLPDQNPQNILATRYDGGYIQPSVLRPDSLNDRIEYADYFTSRDFYRDNYVFYEPDPNKQPGNYNSGFPFHGGVSYGSALGTPGYYPDLNRAVARNKWGEQYQYLFDNGLEFVWQDMTTPAAGNCYGDMLGFPSRLLMSDDVYGQDPSKKPPSKTAIELWSLYSYNLHKATYRGLNRLKGRENKRNFIIGRGSQTGMHRFAGLWTGDNASSWDFWRISVAQVIALGYSGLTIAGVDMGGFTKDAASPFGAPWWCDPELFIRWYSGAFLLPWYRNHYMKHNASKDRYPYTKEFQEPWAYTTAPSRYPQIPSSLYPLYASVEPICRYYVQLRYSLMQVLYDTMFANLINGLPIARAMLITDPDDTSLFEQESKFLDNQYLLGHQILVCPVLDPNVYNRDIYLPQFEIWYPSNLRINVQGFGSDTLKHAATLENAVSGGTTISYGCGIPDAVRNPTQIAYVTPLYIRSGSIIPQIEVRQSVDANDMNPPCIHVYPGNKRTEYSMYLDDGVSRDSAPADLPQYKYSHKLDGQDLSDGSNANEAQSKYREVKITQEYSHTLPYSRIITLSHPWDGYDPTPNIGDKYVFGIWAQKNGAPSDPSQVSIKFEDQDGNPVTAPGLSASYDVTRAVVTAFVPTNLVPSLAGPKDAGTGPSKSFAIKVEVLN